MSSGSAFPVTFMLGKQHSMTSSYDVNLKIDKVPIFPGKCICCKMDSPGDTLEYTVNAIGWWTFLLMFGKKHRCLVPMCAKCKRKVRYNRTKRYIVSGAAIAIGAITAIALLHTYKGPFKVYLGTAIALLAMSP